MRQGWPGAARVAAAVLAGMLAGTLAGCGQPGAGRPDSGAEGLALSFEDAPAPGVFLIEAPAERDGPKGAGGLWAAVRGLARPERAEAVNLATGARVNVALYRAGGSAPAIRLSNEAADALGVEEAPVNIRITALRRRPVIATK